MSYCFSAVKAVLFGDMTLPTVLRPWREDRPTGNRHGLDGSASNPVLQPRGLGQVYPEPITPSLIPAGHLGRGMPELLLDIALIDLGRRGKPGTQAVAGKKREALTLGQVRSDARVKHTSLDEPGDRFVVQPRLQRTLAIPRGAHEDRAKVDLAEMQPLFERMHGAGLFGRSAPNLDLAPAGLGVQGEHGAVVEGFDPAATVGRVVLVKIKADDLGPAQPA